jgi:hypothetical protein
MQIAKTLRSFMAGTRVKGLLLIASAESLTAIEPPPIRSEAPIGGEVGLPTRKAAVADLCLHTVLRSVGCLNRGLRLLN